MQTIVSIPGKNQQFVEERIVRMRMVGHFLLGLRDRNLAVDENKEPKTFNDIQEGDIRRRAFVTNDAS